MRLLNLLLWDFHNQCYIAMGVDKHTPLEEHVASRSMNTLGPLRKNSYGELLSTLNFWRCYMDSSRLWELLIYFVCAIFFMCKLSRNYWHSAQAFGLPKYFNYSCISFLKHFCERWSILKAFYSFLLYILPSFTVLLQTVHVL